MTTIRVATEADAEEILAIYAKYIEQTAITFEYVVPSIEEFRGRIRHTLERFPYLAAEKEGKIAGYAYVSPFKERAAYDWSVETSIYVDMEQKRSGIGRRLYEELENPEKTGFFTEVTNVSGKCLYVVFKAGDKKTIKGFTFEYA